MMETHTGDYGRHSPDKLLTGFTQGRMAMWVITAVVVHVVFIVITSLGSIRDRWIDPEGAAARKVAAEAARKAAAQTALPSVQPAPRTAAGTNAPPGAAGTNAAAGTNVTAASGNGKDEIPEDRRHTPVVKRITDVAKPEEIPKQPNELGISIEETNRR